MGGVNWPELWKKKNHIKLLSPLPVRFGGGVGAEVRSLLTSDRYLERVSGSRSCFPQAHGSAHLSDPTLPTPPRGGHAWEKGLKRAIPLIYDLTQLQDTSSSGMGFCFRGAPRQIPPPASCQRRFKVSAIWGGGGLGILAHNKRGQHSNSISTHGLAFRLHSQMWASCCILESYITDTSVFNRCCHSLGGITLFFSNKQTCGCIKKIIWSHVLQRPSTLSDGCETLSFTVDAFALCSKQSYNRILHSKFCTSTSPRIFTHLTTFFSGLYDPKLLICISWVWNLFRLCAAKLKFLKPFACDNGHGITFYNTICS